MLKDLLTILILGIAAQGVNAATISQLPNKITKPVGSSVTLSATISNLSNSSLTWYVDGKEVANVSVRVNGSKITVGKVKNLTANAEATFVANGSDVMSHLTLKSLTMTLNNTKIKISDGSNESNQALLIVIASEETTPAPTTAEMTTTPKVDETSPETTNPTASSSGTTTTTKSPTTSGCDAPSNRIADCLDFNCTASNDRETMISPGASQTCKETYTCSQSGTWDKTSEDCTLVCIEPGTWGDNCTNACGGGCTVYNDTIRYCDVTSGRCLNDMGQLQTDCGDGYKGENCQEPICVDCNGGICLYPNFCGNCPKDFEHGVTCRNIRLDGFLKGSLSSLAVLAVIVILLTLASKWHINRKIKDA